MSFVESVLHFTGFIYRNHYGRTVLRVDDEAAVLKTLETILRIHGYEVLTATTIDTGLAAVGEHHVDGALVDHSGCKARQSCFLDQITERTQAADGVERDNVPAVVVGVGAERFSQKFLLRLKIVKQ